MVQNGDAAIDFTLLEGLPMSGFDFPSWEVSKSSVEVGYPVDSLGSNTSKGSTRTSRPMHMA
jgi:hypothetical protein